MMLDKLKLDSSMEDVDAFFQKCFKSLKTCPKCLSKSKNTDLKLDDKLARKSFLTNLLHMTLIDLTHEKIMEVLKSTESEWKTNFLVLYSQYLYLLYLPEPYLHPEDRISKREEVYNAALEKVNEEVEMYVPSNYLDLEIENSINDERLKTFNQNLEEFLKIYDEIMQKLMSWRDFFELIEYKNIWRKNEIKIKSSAAAFFALLKYNPTEIRKTVLSALRRYNRREIEMISYKITGKGAKLMASIDSMRFPAPLRQKIQKTIAKINSKTNKMVKMVDYFHIKHKTIRKIQKNKNNQEDENGIIDYKEFLEIMKEMNLNQIKDLKIIEHFSSTSELKTIQSENFYTDNGLGLELVDMKVDVKLDGMFFTNLDGSKNLWKLFKSFQVRNLCKEIQKAINSLENLLKIKVMQEDLENILELIEIHGTRSMALRCGKNVEGEKDISDERIEYLENLIGRNINDFYSTNVFKYKKHASDCMLRLLYGKPVRGISSRKTTKLSLSNNLLDYKKLQCNFQGQNENPESEDSSSDESNSCFD